MAPSVLIVDDHPSFRSTARMLLELEGYTVLGEAPDGETAIAQARALRPDIVLLDVNLPDMDGFEVAARLSAIEQPPAVVLVSSREASEYGPLVGTSGARGFIAKADLSGAALEEVLAA
ncbi:response regulator transcription factor [Svornostia abyssi]|uniref:Response regulator transcription factor n=1 Tax=Svornostia abyssi TaxID=2898438 RepID=A0ABY5PBS9_9ACTN|nr:response regulator transcription factor [Parviterribacteraceae bacterium J379]